MLEWLVIGVIGAFFLIREDVKNEVFEKEKELMEEIEVLEKKLIDEKAKVQKSIEFAHKQLNFDTCRLAHYNSHQAGQLARDLLEKEKIVIKGLKKGLTRVNKQVVKSLVERSNLKPYSEERELKHKEVESGQKLQKSINQDIINIRTKADNIKNDIKLLDKDTHTLKLLIRDNFGNGGRVWYNRIQRRIENNEYITPEYID